MERSCFFFKIIPSAWFWKKNKVVPLIFRKSSKGSKIGCSQKRIMKSLDQQFKFPVVKRAFSFGWSLHRPGYIYWESVLFPPQSDYFSQFCRSLVQCFTLLFPKSSKYLNYSHLFSLESIDIFWPVIIFELWKDWKKNVSEKLEIMMFKFYHFSPQALSTFLVLVSNYFICFSYWYVSRKWDDVLSSSWFFVVNLHLGKFGPPLGIGIS